MAINVEEYAVANSISTPTRHGIRDFTEVFEHIAANNNGNPVIELNSGRAYGYSKTLIFGRRHPRQSRVTFQSTNPGGYAANAAMIAIPNADGEWDHGMKDVVLPGNPDLGMPAFDESSNDGRIPFLPDHAKAGIWTTSGGIVAVNIHFDVFEHAFNDGLKDPFIHLWLVHYHSDGNREDTDPHVLGCSFGKSGGKRNDPWSTAIYHEGRGLKVRNSFFNNKRIGVTQSYPDEIYDVARDGTEDSQHFNAGNRKFALRNNQAHGLQSTLVSFTSDSAVNRGAIITNNQMDLGGRLITATGSGISNAVISNNVNGASNYSAVYDINTDVFSNNVLTNNTVMGAYDYFQITNERRPNNAFKIKAKKAKGNIISNNAIANIEDHGILIKSPAKGTSIVGNTSTGGSPFLKAHKKATGMVANNATDGDLLINGGRMTTANNLIYSDDQSSVNIISAQDLSIDQYDRALNSINVVANFARNGKRMIISHQPKGLHLQKYREVDNDIIPIRAGKYIEDDVYRFENITGVDLNNDTLIGAWT